MYFDLFAKYNAHHALLAVLISLRILTCSKLIITQEAGQCYDVHFYLHFMFEEAKAESIRNFSQVMYPESGTASHYSMLLYLTAM